MHACTSTANLGRPVFPDAVPINYVYETVDERGYSEILISKRKVHKTTKYVPQSYS